MTASIIVGAALPGTVIGAANNTSAGAAGATKPASAAPASTGKTKTVEIKVGEMSFTPAMAMANVGDTISWVNIGKIPHTVTAKDGSFDKTPIAPAERFNFVLRKEGSFPYVCSYHPGMDATLMVGPALAGVAVPGAEAGKTKPDSPAPVSTGNAKTHVIEVKDSSFTPATLEAHVGDTISWVNLGKIPHTVTARDHSFDKSLKPGQRFNLVLTKTGNIPYVCTPHHEMFGVLIVGPALNSAKTINAAPMTLESTPPVAMAGVGAGWLLIIGLLLVIQLRSRTTARATRAALHRRTLPGDPS
jgi:plastocyanin